MCKWLHASGRPYEVANDVFLPDVLQAAFEAGAKEGLKRRLKFKVDDETFGDADYVRKSLPRHYDQTVEFWKPIIKKAHEEGNDQLFFFIFHQNENKNVVQHNCNYI